MTDDHVVAAVMQRVRADQPPPAHEGEARRTRRLFGRVAAPPPPPRHQRAATSEEALQEAESVLGKPLPTILRRLFSEVANGGFGPGYGLLGVREGHPDDMRMTALDLVGAPHLQTKAATLWPLCHWGCAIYSLVDCDSPDGRLWAFDPNPAPEGVDALVPVEDTLAGWLLRWAEDRLLQPALVQDDGTGAWRAATDSELRHMMTDY